MKRIRGGVLGEECLERTHQASEAGPTAGEAGGGGEDDPAMGLAMARVV